MTDQRHPWIFGDPIGAVRAQLRGAEHMLAQGLLELEAEKLHQELQRKKAAGAT